ncbi:MAG: ABC transporter substrate-binding protein [Armatimonadota bacterium]|nr:ABC transporter substrate-binding protein [Armatimonadota bacterium]
MSSPVRRLVLALLLVGALLGSLAAPGHLAAQARRGGNLIIATRASAEPASMDAQVDPYAMTWLLNSFVADPLVALTASGEYKPMLASGWQISPNGLVLTLRLRSGVKFQDGTPVNAEAVKFNIDRVMNPETRSALMANYLGSKNFQRTEVINDTTLKVYYSAPVPSVLWGLSILPIWSPAAVRKFGRDFHQNLVGAGAFRMAEWVKGSHIKFVKIPNYAGGPPGQEHTGPAYLDSITVRFVGEEGVLGEVLRAGEVNMVMELPAQALGNYRNNPNYQVVAGYQPGSGMQFVMNTSRPPLDDIRVRRALRHAYDPDRMNQTLYDNNYVVVKGPVTKYTRCYWKGAEEAYRMDLDRSRALLDEAGWRVNARTGIREKDGRPLSLGIAMLHHKELGEYLATQFRAIGVELRVEVIPGPVQLQRAASGQFDLMYQRLRSFEPDDLFSLWYSQNNYPGGWAWSRFQDATLDQILLRTQFTADPRERCRLFTEAQKMITDFALALPTLDSPIYYAMHRSVKNFKLGAFGAWFFVKDMYIER